MCSSAPDQAAPRIEITSDLSSIDLGRVHAWLARKSYWAGQMPRSVFDRATNGSLCFGAIKDGKTVGFARVISDRATFAYLSDVFVDPEHRGLGIGKAILSSIMRHPELQDLRLWVLVTSDAHGLYARHGFKTPAKPERYMERRDPDVYQRMAEMDAI
ncbi:MAG: GNAT family N-acetyltransferase [Hyphomicrobiaceae bacterium]|nr:GNAT family N-acetyltransferase [Hyphomicrobiaceae bacterium]